MADYDVIVLGGGSAGTSAASAATRAGARTLMINDGELGGLCILRGCMPTKAMLASTHALHEAQTMEPLGVRLEGRAVHDFRAIMQRKDRLVARFKAAKLEGIEASDYEVLDGRGRFVAGGGVEVGDRVLTAGAYVVSSGSVPVILPIPGIDRVPVWTSDDVMRLAEQPKRLIVQGAGPVGLELAQFFARIGTRVVLVNRSALLSHYEAEVGRELHAALAAEPHLELAVPGTIEELWPEGSGLNARIVESGATREVRADALLMAAGRRAAIDDIGLEHVGLDPVGGRLEHAPTMRTGNPAIYVAGDSTGENQILHLANSEGAVAGHNAAGGRPEKLVDDRLLIQVYFTDPPYAQVGLTEKTASERGCDCVVGRAYLPNTGRAITMETPFGLWKLVAERKSGELLGSAMLGPRADDIAHVIAAIMRYRGTLDDVLELPWYHPTISEVMLDLARDIKRQL